MRVAFLQVAAIDGTSEIIDVRGFCSDFCHIEPFAGDRSASLKLTARNGEVYLNRIGGHFWSETTAESSRLQVSLFHVFQESTHELGVWVEQDKFAFITQHTACQHPKYVIGMMFTYLHHQSMYTVWGRAIWLGLFCYALFKPLMPAPATKDPPIYILRHELMGEIYRGIQVRREVLLKGEPIDEILATVDVSDRKETATKLSEFAYRMAGDMVDPLARFGHMTVDERSLYYS